MNVIATPGPSRDPGARIEQGTETRSDAKQTARTTRRPDRNGPLLGPCIGRGERIRNGRVNRKFTRMRPAERPAHAHPKGPNTPSPARAAARRRRRRWRRRRRRLHPRCRRGRSSTPGLRTQTHKGCPLSDARAGGSCTLADTVCATDRAKSEHISGFLRPDCCAHRAQLTELAKIPPWIAIWR